MISNLQQRTDAVNRVIRLAKKYGAQVLAKDVETTVLRLQLGTMICLVNAGRDGSGFCKTRWFVNPDLDPNLQKTFEDTADRKIFGIGQRRNAPSNTLLLRNLEEQFMALKTNEVEVPVAA